MVGLVVVVAVIPLLLLLLVIAFLLLADHNRTSDMKQAAEALKTVLQGVAEVIRALRRRPRP